MKFFEDFKITECEFNQLLANNPSLRGFVFGYVAEVKCREIVCSSPEIKYLGKYPDSDRTKKGDMWISYNDKVFSIECKSVLTGKTKYNSDSKTFIGRANVDGSDCRDITLPNGSTVRTSLMQRGEFDILAINCFAMTGKWDFVFIRNSDLPCTDSPKYTEYEKSCLISSSVYVSFPVEKPFYTDLKKLLDDAPNTGAPITKWSNYLKKKTVSFDDFLV